MNRQTQLPFRTDDLDTIGGEIKESASDFVVEEVPLYEPEEDGQHVYVRLTREGRTTREVVERLAEIFGVSQGTIGYAGMKDRQARATQTFSLDSAAFDRPKPSDEEVAARIREEMDCDVSFARRHRNKLRRGHLVGNRFRVLIRSPKAADSVERARAIADALIERGVPNFYGAQRFGREGDNAAKGLEILRTGSFDGPHWKRRLLCNAYQSSLFNRWLAERMDRGDFDRLLLGDVAKKTDTGGLFEVEELDREQERFERREITFTGPIYGHDLWWAVGEAGEFERAFFEEADVGMEALREANLKGSRRRGRIHLDELEVAAAEDGVELTFELPKGAYATVVLREFL